MMDNSACSAIAATSQHLGLNSNRLLASNHPTTSHHQAQNVPTLTIQQGPMVQIQAFSRADSNRMPQ